MPRIFERYKYEGRYEFEERYEYEPFSRSREKVPAGG
jgi:hypothetical protein